MYLTDFHVHSHNSFDGYMSVDEIADLAVKRNIRELCITDHYECSDHGVKMEQGFIKTGIEIKNTQKRIGDVLKLRFGIELGQMHFEPELCEKIIKENEFDFIIGSVHNLKNDFDIYYLKFDEKNSLEVFDEYLDNLRLLALNADYDVLGHITYPLRYMARDGVNFDISPYLGRIDEILEIVIKRGRGIEVNVSGFANQLNDSMPPLSLIKRYKELGGKIITTGSDAHKPERVGADIVKGIELIRAAGFENFAVFEKRAPSFIRI